MAAIYSNGGNRWNILGFNFTERDALSSVYKISMMYIRYNWMSGVNKFRKNHNFCRELRSKQKQKNKDVMFCFEQHKN
jgi:hypothetical protein